MKKDIHPAYHTKTKVKCACGNEFIIPSTLKNIEIEACSNCHPVYTGQDRGAIRGGRVEKFQARMEKKTTFKKKTEKRAGRKIKDEKKSPKK